MIRNTFLFGSLLFLAACSKSSSTTGLSTFPAIASAVDSAAPTALKASSSRKNNYFSISDGLRVHSDSATIRSSLQGLIKGSYGKLSGGNGVGYMNAYLEDLDSRFTELKNRFTDNAPTCLSNTPATYSVDLSAVETGLANTLKVDMDVQCLDVFNSDNAGEQSGSGSGLLFGKSGENYSMMLLLNNKTTAESGFGYAARVTNKGAADETVDLIFGEANEATNQRTVVARLKAKPQAKTYELLVGSSAVGGMNPLSGNAPQLGCGAYVISDGTYIHAKGRYLGAGMTCAGNSSDFEHCYNASDLTDTALSNCDTLKTTYTIGDVTDFSQLEQADFTNKYDDIYNALQINTDAVKAKTTSTSSR